MGLLNNNFMEILMKRIHIHQGKIRSNKKHGTNDPAITVKTYKKNTQTVVVSNEYAHEVVILGASKIIYSPDNPLACGARVWIETDAEVSCS